MTHLGAAPPDTGPYRGIYRALLAERDARDTLQVVGQKEELNKINLQYFGLLNAFSSSPGWLAGLTSIAHYWQSLAIQSQPVG